MRWIRYSNCRGFVYVEVLLTILFIGIFLTAIVLLFQIGNKMEQKNQNKKYALTLAQEQIELVRELGARKKLPQGNQELPWYGTEALPLRNGMVSYQVITRLESMPESPELRQVTVTVTWNQSEHLSFTTFLAE